MRFALKSLTILFILLVLGFGQSQTSLGEKIFNKLISYCPKCYPIIWGSLTSEPRILLVVPFKFWASLSADEKFALAEYMNFFVKDSKRNPKKYFNEETQNICTVNPNALICAIQKSAIKSVKGWEIALGVYYKSKLFVNETLICSPNIKKCDGLNYSNIKNNKKRFRSIEKSKLFFDNNFVLEKRKEWIKYYKQNGILR